MSPKVPTRIAMAPAEPKYFTCTLGEAALARQRDCSGEASFSSIIDVIDWQAEHSTSSPAIGFADLGSKRDGAECVFPSRVRVTMVCFHEN